MRRSDDQLDEQFDDQENGQENGSVSESEHEQKNEYREPNPGMRRGWFLLAAGAVIIAILTIVLFGTDAPEDNEKAAQEAATTTADVPSDTDEGQNIGTLDTSGWVTYENDEFDFAIDHPQNWVVEAGSQALTPMITIYQPPLPPDLEPPLTHHDDATHVSIFPHGIPTEGIFGQTEPTSVETTLAFRAGQDFVLENGQPWATMLAFSDTPASWNESGFVWARVHVSNFETFCTRANREIEMNECDPLVMEDKIRRSGSIDESAREVEEAILSTFRFTANANTSSAEPENQ